MKKFIALFAIVLMLASTAFASTAGPSFPTTTSGNLTTVAGAGCITWTSPGNITANDSVFATVSLTAFAVGCDLIGQGYGFSIPSTATINGITAEVNAKQTVGSGSPVCQDLTVKLLKAGTAAGNNKAVPTNITTTAATITYGGAADLWGTTWTPTDINASTFGLVWVGWESAISATATLSVDFMRITVTFTAPANGSKMLQLLSQTRYVKLRGKRDRLAAVVNRNAFEFPDVVLSKNSIAAAKHIEHALHVAQHYFKIEESVIAGIQNAGHNTVFGYLGIQGSLLST